MATKAALERDPDLRVRRARAAVRDRLDQRRHPTRQRMRALSLRPGARFEWSEVPVPPPPGPDGAIVHPIAMATCDLDRMLALGGTPFPLPLHFGHECVAEVLEVGERVTTVQPGRRVVVPFQINCGSCAACRAGHTGNCLSVPPLSMYGFGFGGGHWGGAVSDRLAVPFADGMLVPLPEGIDPAAAASVADNVCDGYRHVGPYAADLLARDADASFLILAGVSRKPRFSSSIGLYAGLVAQALGFREIHLVDSRAHVREHAERLGIAAHRPSDLRRLTPAPLVMDASASPAGLRAALTHTAPDGICSSAGGLHRTARIPTGTMYARNATYTVSRTHARAVMPKVLELMRAGKLQPELVTTDLAALDDAPRALRDHATGEATKTILVE
ncbi:MAG TPA: alcohol dehydrogenase catalytic domain-containing protein [Thermoleophilaceae bacterium]|nr:alcohol dehydrogenase catalytic domain-containing protein [Thermoleophilaceae bacterium]